jgi:hypothetical protein
MNNGVKAAIGATVVLILAVGGEALWLHHERNAPAVVKAPEREVIAEDDLVFLKKKRPDSLKDVKELKGSTVWVSAGGQLDYYPLEQTAPKAATFRIPGGDKQVLLVFTKPNDSKEYAVPVGYRQGTDYTFYTDEIFFYDDPHELYKHWGPEIWKAVDAHQVILGMNERQVELALGQVSKSTSTDYGNRMVVFANLGKPMAVTFVKNKVTAFRADQGY